MVRIVSGSVELGSVDSRQPCGARGRADHGNRRQRSATLIKRAKIWRPARLLAGAGALVVSLGAAAGNFPLQVLHRLSLEGSAPVTALAFDAPDTHLYAAVGDEVRSFAGASGEPGSKVKLPGAVAALAPDDGAGVLFAAVRSPARLVILRLDPLRIVRSVALRAGVPSGLLFDPIAHTLFAESRLAGTVARLDPRTGRGLGVVHLAGGLEQMAGDGRRTLYIANSEENAVDVIDTARMRNLGDVPAPGCSAPTGLAMDPMGRRLFVACTNGKALIIDTDMGFTFERLPIGGGGAQRVAFALLPFGAQGWKGGAFIAGGDSQLDGIRMLAFIKYVHEGQLPLAGRCTALALNPTSGELWLALAAGGGKAAGAARGESDVELWGLGSAGPEVAN
jgi:DNA-binding beta-propeller fold protein YncE